MVKYVFLANSVKGLVVDKVIYAKDYTDARRKILRFIVRGCPNRAETLNTRSLTSTAWSPMIDFFFVTKEGSSEIIGFIRNCKHACRRDV